MSKFPLIAKWLPGLEVIQSNYVDRSYVWADDLERELARASIVQSKASDISQWQTSWPERHDGYSGNSHHALLLGPRPLRRPRKREVSEDEVRAALNGMIVASGSTNVTQIIERLFGESEER